MERDEKRELDELKIDDGNRSEDCCCVSLAVEEEQCCCCGGFAEGTSGEEKTSEEMVGALEEECRGEARRDVNKWISFFELPQEVVALACGSVIPPEIISYYRQFGLSEEEIRLIFQMRPSEEASCQPEFHDSYESVRRPGG